jgi:hypothetical protein
VSTVDAEFEREMQKVASLEDKIRAKPILASGIQYDTAADSWFMKRFGDEAGTIKWGLRLEFTPANATFGDAVCGGNRTYHLLSVACTKWAVYAAFELSANTSQEKTTKLLSRTDPTRNRVFLISSSSRLQAIEGTLDLELFGPHPAVGLVAFPVPQGSAKNVSIEFVFKSGPGRIPILFGDEDVFQRESMSDGLVEAVRNLLGTHLASFKGDAEKTKEEIGRMAARRSGCLLLVILFFLGLGLHFLP